jgi:hypothetical protein
MSSENDIERAKHLNDLIARYGYTIDLGILTQNFDAAVDYTVRHLKREGWSNAAICERSFEIEDDVWRNGFMIPTDDPSPVLGQTFHEAVKPTQPARHTTEPDERRPFECYDDWRERTTPPQPSVAWTPSPKPPQGM